MDAPGLIADARLALDRAGAGVPDLRSVPPDHARAAAEDFEAVFLSQMLEEFGKVIARAGGVGIAENVHREILKLQEVK